LVAQTSTLLSNIHGQISLVMLLNAPQFISPGRVHWIGKDGTPMKSEIPNFIGETGQRKPATFTVSA
jgi:hypothetical protein